MGRPGFRGAREDTATLDEILTEMRRRNEAVVIAGPVFSADAICFGPQKLAVLSPSKRKVLKCGRRAGKTVAVDVAMLEAGKAGEQVLYVTLTRANAKDLVWADLMMLNDQYRLGGAPHLSDLTMTFGASGGTIALRGANNEREIAKIRGKKFHKVFVDESQSVPDRILRPLVTEILLPTLLDYGGTLWMIGTAVPVQTGYFWECYAGGRRQRWEQHAWDVRDNVKLPARRQGKAIEEILAEFRAENGWTEADTTYRREILNEDVEDLGALLYEYDARRNGEPPPPRDAHWTYVIGVDIGFDDSDAIAVLGWRRGERKIYLVREFVKSGQDVTDLANRLREVIKEYPPLKVVIDQGGLGKKIAVELSVRHDLSLQPAEKARKGEFIKLFNADLRKGLFHASPRSKFADDCRIVRKDPEALARGELKELPSTKGGGHSDICFVAGTMIAGKDGDVPIETVRVGDRVWTRAGLRRVTHAYRTGFASPIVTADFGGGRRLTGTPDHPIWTSAGWKPLAALDNRYRFMTVGPHNPRFPDPRQGATFEEFAAVRVTPAGTAPVYAISVEGEHEYFANGILVKNCDSVLYGWRECLAHFEEPVVPPAPEEDRAFEARLREVDRRQGEEPWEKQARDLGMDDGID